MKDSSIHVRTFEYNQSSETIYTGRVMGKNGYWQRSPEFKTKAEAEKWVSENAR